MQPLKTCRLFRHQRVAIVEEARKSGGAADLVKPVQRIVAQGCVSRPAGPNQPVLDVIDERGSAVGGELPFASQEKLALPAVEY